MTDQDKDRCTLHGCNRQQSADIEFCQKHAADFEQGRQPRW